MESIYCPVCQSPDARFLWSKEGSRYVRCRHCALVYENPRLSPQELVDFYSQKSYFIQDGEDTSTSGYQNYFSQCTQTLCEEYFGIVERYSKKITGNFCDVGCGLGGVLSIAETKGWKAFGVEISSWAAGEGQKSGLNIFNGSLLEAKYPSDYFDAVSLFDVLEHLAAPREYLNEIHRILRPGGSLVIETPNVDGLFARFIYRQKADLVKPHAHICLYGPRSARHLLMHTGFVSHNIMTFPYSRSISPGYLKSLLISRIKRQQSPPQFTLNDSLRIVSRK